jgi:hypothetical protein
MYSRFRSRKEPPRLKRINTMAPNGRMKRQPDSLGIVKATKPRRRKSIFNTSITIVNAVIFFRRMGPYFTVPILGLTTCTLASAAARETQVLIWDAAVVLP